MTVHECSRGLLWIVRGWASVSSCTRQSPTTWCITGNLIINNMTCPVQFSRSVVSDSLRPHGLQHARPPCPSPTPGVYSNPCPLSQWCHPTVSSSVVPFSCLQSLPASGSFQMTQFFASGGQRIGPLVQICPLVRKVWIWWRQSGGKWEKTL